MVFSVRGAVTIAHKDLSHASERVYELISSIMSTNALAKKHIITMIFSQTDDLSFMNASSCIRSRGFTDVSLFTVSEALWDATLPMTVRVLVFAQKWIQFTRMKSVYLYTAQSLRTDLQH